MLLSMQYQCLHGLNMQGLKGIFGSSGGALELPHYISGPAENMQDSLILLLHG